MADYSIMSLNLKNTGPLNIGSMAFEDRVSSIEELICWNDPDLIGIQELTDDMIPFLPHTFDAYQFYGKARGNEDFYANERCCILFKKDRFDILSGSTFWLSDTPDKCGSFYPGSIYPRIATIGILQDRTDGTIFTFANTHLDHVLPAVRTRQALVLRNELLKRRRGEFLILTGDFNATRVSAAITLLSTPSDPLEIKDLAPRQGATIRDRFASTFHRRMPIDHIFVSKKMDAKCCRIITSLYMGKAPSDHCPLLAQCSWNHD
jgi:endonuclease/exonuclease/phosphatase family metal-dependent hydrolase